MRAQNGADFLGEPPVLSTEDRAGYVSLQDAIAEAVEPKDAIERIWVADMTDISWQVRRLRHLRKFIVDKKYNDLLVGLILSISSTRAERDGVNLFELSLDGNDNEYNKEIEDMKQRIIRHFSSGTEYGWRVARRFFLRQGKDISELNRQAIYETLDEVTRLEVLIEGLCRRYDSTVREVERRRDGIARRLRDIIDAEFKDVKPRRAAGGN